MNNVDSETLETIRDALRAQCEQVEELDRQTIVRVWRDWNVAYPLEPKPHGSVLKSDIVSRLCVVLRSLKGRHALAAYEQQAPEDLFILCVDALVGWRCKGSRGPRLDDIDATLIVTRTDFAWTFGVHEVWKRDSLYGGPVFVEPEMLPEALL
jgi:hypothetical protein